MRRGRLQKPLNDPIYGVAYCWPGLEDERPLRFETFATPQGAALNLATQERTFIFGELKRYACIPQWIEVPSFRKKDVESIFVDRHVAEILSRYDTGGDTLR